MLCYVYNLGEILILMHNQCVLKYIGMLMRWKVWHLAMMVGFVVDYIYRDNNLNGCYDVN